MWTRRLKLVLYWRWNSYYLHLKISSGLQIVIKVIQDLNQLTAKKS